MRLTYQTSQKGFTLVEMVIVIPIVILIIGGVVASVIQMTGSALRMQARSQLQLDVLMALNRIEQDVRLSTAISSASSTSLTLTSLSTNRSPADQARLLIRASDCTPTDSEIELSEALSHQSVYSPAGDSYNLNTNLAVCGSSWQKNGPEKLIPNATVSADITYQTVGVIATNVVKIDLQATRRVAGTNISYTGSMYAKSVNIR